MPVKHRTHDALRLGLGALVFTAALGAGVFAAQADRVRGATDTWSNQLPSMNNSPAGVYGAPSSSGRPRRRNGGGGYNGGASYGGYGSGDYGYGGGAYVVCFAGGSSCNFWSNVAPPPGTLCHCGGVDGLTQ